MSTGLSVLGIDTSCYTTSAALARDGEIVAFERRLLPVPGGERGLRQSEAVFAHVKQLPDVLSAVLTAGPVGAVSVSVKPTDAEESYMPVFACGRSFARSIAAALLVPLFETTHQRGHIRAAMIGTNIRPGDMLAVHLSGGTTDVLLVEKGKITAMGSSLDLHAGQLVDRVGVSMDLSFPAGPALEKLAMQSKGAGSRLKASVSGGNCHLSGAETQLYGLLKSGLSREDAAMEVYDLLARTLLKMLCFARDQSGVSNVLLAGGVASSGILRTLMQERNEKRRMGLSLTFGNPRYCSDNAAGVALIGEEKWLGGQ